MNESMGPLSRVLETGLRVIELPVPGRLATALSIAFPAGIRHEQEREDGVAHLLEHMAFKGTDRFRSARELNRSAERLGTELNAHTADDYVEFFSTVRAESAVPVLDLLADLAGSPLLDERHLEVERAVVLQELADQAEEPGAIADELIFAAVFGKHRLGMRTAREADGVKRLAHTDLVAFRHRQWVGTAGVAVFAGNLEHLPRSVVDEVLNRIRAGERPPAPPAIPQFVRRVVVEQHESDVAHLRLAYRVPALDRRRLSDQAVADVLSQMIGGPAGSRLFEELRETRGLCYAIDGHLSGYDDASLLWVDCSLRAVNVPEAYRAINAIIEDLRVNGPEAEELSRARAYAAGARALTYESITARADYALAVFMEHGGDEQDPMRYLQAVESVTGERVSQIAASIDARPCVGCLGSVDPEAFD